MSTLFTTREKFMGVMREIRFRRRVYPKQIIRGRMTEDQVRREIELMEAIAADYIDRMRGQQKVVT